jgi:hypothetical protein
MLGHTGSCVGVTAKNERQRRERERLLAQMSAPRPQNDPVLGWRLASFQGRTVRFDRVLTEPLTGGGLRVVGSESPRLREARRRWWHEYECGEQPDFLDYPMDEQQGTSTDEPSHMEVPFQSEAASYQVVDLQSLLNPPSTTMPERDDRGTP